MNKMVEMISNRKQKALEAISQEKKVVWYLKLKTTALCLLTLSLSGLRLFNISIKKQITEHCDGVKMLID